MSQVARTDTLNAIGMGQFASTYGVPLGGQHGVGLGAEPMETSTYTVAVCGGSTLISHSHRCIFIHIPKCAGTSIEDALGHFAGYTGRGAQDHRSLRVIEEPLPLLRVFRGVENVTHLRRRLLARLGRHDGANPANRLRVNSEQYRRYFKFSVVRNPWARAYSWYSNVLRDPQHRREHGLTEPPSLRLFLERHAGRGMLRPQLEWLRAFDGSIPLDFIGRFETLEADFRTICSRLGVERSLPHRVAGSGADYRSVYDSFSRDLIAERYEEEIRLFGYAFEK